MSDMKTTCSSSKIEEVPVKMSINDLQNINVKRCEELYFGINKWNVLEWAGAMAGEAGEAANVAKKIRRDGYNDDAEKAEKRLQDYADELADTVIYATLAAERAGINLEEAIVKKFNEKSEKHNSSFRL